MHLPLWLTRNDEKHVCFSCHKSDFHSHAYHIPAVFPLRFLFPEDLQLASQEPVVVDFKFV